jgi:hypothetical protein
MDPVNLSKINVTVKRNVGDGEIAGLKFIIDDGENTEVVEVNNFSLEELQERMFNLSLTDIQNSSKIQKISVAPIFELESGKVVTGDVKDEYEISEGSGTDVISCTPNCVGKQCGSNGCSGTCGTCSTGTCNSTGQCVTTCTPASCAGKSCGSWANGTCSGTLNCGTCSTGTCNSTGQCVTSCTPASCAGKSCGSWANGTCSGTLNCGTCSTGTCNSTGQCIASTIYEENFEGNFPPTGWKTGGDISWNKNTTYIIRGSASAASGAVEGAYKRSWINYTRNFPYGGYVSFYWNVSSEADYDFLCFCQDKECGNTGCTCYYPSGTADARISSSSNGVWAYGFENWSVTTGNHFFTWCYATDSGTDPGAHMGIIDNVTFNQYTSSATWTWTPELITNPGFENGDFTGWTTSDVDWAVGIQPPNTYNSTGGTSTPQAGSYCAFHNSGSSLNYYIYQDVNLTSYSSYIAAGNAVINASGWKISSEYDCDEGRIQIIFLGVSGNILSTALDTDYGLNESWWQAKISNYPIPTNARYVRMWGNTEEDPWDSGSLDSFSVKVGYIT